MTWAARVRRRLVAVRAAAWAGAAVAGGGALGLAAWADGRAWVVPALCGGALSCLAVARTRPLHAAPAGEIDPAHDPDGLLRAALAVAESEPFAAVLQSEAAGRTPHFRPAAEWRPLGLLAFAVLGVGLWQRSEPVVGPGARLEASRGSPGEAPATGAPDETAEARREPAAEPGDPAGGAPDLPGEAAEASPPQRDARGDNGPATAPVRPGGPPGEAATEWVPAPLRAGSPGRVAGRSFGRMQPVIDRYLRLRAERRP